jgi:hypothetical protein
MVQLTQENLDSFARSNLALQLRNFGHIAPCYRFLNPILVELLKLKGIGIREIAGMRWSVGSLCMFKK